MSGRRRRGLSPSLFPFLAVLVCTLGTLILLLALVAQKANDAATELQESQVAEHTEADPAMPTLTAAAAQSMIDEEKFRVQQLVAFRDAQTKEIGSRKDQLTHLEDHLARIREQLKQLSDEVEMATGTKQVDKVDPTMLASLRRRIEQESKELEKLRAEKQDTSPRIVIVPHQGPNGTDRRPIYLECDAEGLTIWPEGTRISLVQLRDTQVSANPLDAALRVVRHHALQHYRDPIAPYPLLVVRPDGIDAYSEARRAMLDWDDQFGYELVPAGVKLAFNQPDPQLKERIDLVVREAVSRQQARHNIASVGGSGGSGTVSSGQRFPTLSAKSLGRQGQASGFRSSDDPRQLGAATFVPASDGASGSAGGVDGSVAARRLDDHLRTAMEEMRDSNVGSGLSGTGTNEASGNESLVNAAAGDSPAHREGTPGEHDYTRPVSDAERNARLDAQTRVQAALRGDMTSEGELSPDAAGSNGDPGPSSQAGKLAANQPTSASTGQGGTSTRPSMGSQSASADASSPAANSVSASSGTPPAMVSRRGPDWALPKSVAQSRGNAIVRTIRVQCYDDRIVLLPSREEAATEIFGVTDGDITRATLELATAVRDRIERWGAAIPGGRWQPSLAVEVMPGGEARYHQIRTLLDGSGVEVQGRLTQ